MHNVLVLYDIAKTASTGETLGWAYHKRALSLQQHAPDDMQIEIMASGDALKEPSTLQNRSLIFLIEYAHAIACRNTMKLRGITCPLVISHNSDRHRRHELWGDVLKSADFVIANNRCVWDFFKGPKKTCNISNGVDTRWWFPSVPIAERPHKVLWCGSSNWRKRKGYGDVLQPAQERLESLGFECDFRPIDDINEQIVYPTEKQAEWYNSGSYVVCMSETEGTPGTSLEGMASGCVLVTTPVGNVKEFGRHGENCLMCERSPEALIANLQYARENRERLSAAAVETMQDWSYGEPGNRAQWFYHLWRALISGRTPEPFTYMEKHWNEI